MVSSRFFALFCATLILSACAASDDALVRRIDLLGAPVIGQSGQSGQSGQRTIAITADTVSVDVTSGETVRFVVGARSFAWSFQVSPTVTTFDLNQVAPPGLLPHRIAVYVAPNPLYISNS